jgi:hypothetical protein
MSEKRKAIFVNDGYYLLPEGISSAEELLSGMSCFPASVTLRELKENNEIPSNNLDLGICIAPYFYGEYGFEEVEVTIEDPSDVFPVEVELFTQAEYNGKLRETVQEFCPGCVRYKPLSNRVQSLNGHFEEIALNSVCFYRQESKPAPRVFRSNMLALGGLWYHFTPAEREASIAADDVKSMTYLKYDTAEWREGETRELLVSFKPDFFSQKLTEALSRYCLSTANFEPFVIHPRFAVVTGISSFRNQIAPENENSFRKNCKKYGVALAVLTFDPEYEAKVEKSITALEEAFFASVLFRESGALYLLLLDECGFMKALHFRSPLLQASGAAISVYDQYGEKSCRVSFDMKEEEKE